MTTNLYLIRHGQSVANVEPIVAGMVGDAGLTALGVQQAEALRDRLAATKEIKADVLIASTLPRARQTAEIIAPALGLPITWDDDVQEMRPGDSDGMSLEEAHEKYGIPDFRYEPLRLIAPGGESWGHFTLRVGIALNRIAEQYRDKTIAIVCHGGVIDSAFLCFFEMSTLTLPPVEFYTNNTSITQWQHRQQRNGEWRWRLVKYNDALHLREIGAAEKDHWSAFAKNPAIGEDHPAVPLPTEE